MNLLPSLQKFNIGLITLILSLTFFLPHGICQEDEEIIEESLDEFVEETLEDNDIIFDKIDREGDSDDESYSKTMNTPEVEKNKKLLLKAINDLDAFRVSMKYVGDHDDSDSRLLLLYETDKFIEKFVDPLLSNYMMRAKDIFHLAAYLEFLKAYLFFESGQPYRYKEAVRSMKKKYGTRHLNVPVTPFKEQFRTIGEAISILGKEIP